MAERMGVLGKKLGMSHVFTEDGIRIPVTVVQAGPCIVLGKRTPDQHGYAAIQLGFDDQKPQRVTKPQMGQFNKAGVEPKKFIREIRIPASELDKYEVGQAVSLSDVFSEGDFVDVTGTSKGRGFQGVMKRHNFAGFKATHGTHEYFRHGGSIGNRLTPGRTVKGRKMAGHMGSEKVTIQNLKVVAVRPDENVLLIRGAVPGATKGYLVVRKAVKKSAKAA